MRLHQASEVAAFFAWSNDLLDRMVLKPLSHITMSWELTWDPQANRYEPEEGSFAELLNELIVEIAACEPPEKYHENEDRLAEYVIQSLGWNIRKENGRWVGADYDVILEQGGSWDINEQELIKASAGRVHAALDRGQMHFDDM